MQSVNAISDLTTFTINYSTIIVAITADLHFRQSLATTHGNRRNTQRPCYRRRDSEEYLHRLLSRRPTQNEGQENMRGVSSQ